MQKLLATLVLTLGTAAGAQTFWQVTQFGDSPEQAKKKVPSLTEPLITEELQRKGIGALMTTSVTIADIPFVVYLEFTADGLQKVMLQAQRQHSLSEADAAHDTLMRSLREKYGNVAKHQDPARAVIQKEPLWMQWRSGETEVLLVPQYGTSQMLISYQLSQAAQRRANATSAQQRTRRLDTKREAGKL